MQPTADTYPVNLTIDYPESSSRLLAAFSIPFFLIRFLLLMPAFICIYIVGIAVYFVVWIAFWAVTFTGRYPRGMFDFVTGYLRWLIRITAYMYGLTDKYPPFRMSA